MYTSGHNTREREEEEEEDDDEDADDVDEEKRKHPKALSRINKKGRRRDKTSRGKTKSS